MPPKKSCVINPASGRALAVPGVTYNKLVKQGAFKKDSIAEKKGKIREAKKAASKTCKAVPKTCKVKKVNMKPTETPKDEYKRLDVLIKKLENELSDPDTKTKKERQILNELTTLRMQKIKAKRAIKK